MRHGFYVVTPALSAACNINNMRKQVVYKNNCNKIFLLFFVDLRVVMQGK